MFSGPLEDRILIRELFGTYAGCAFRQDAETWLSLYTEDGVWNLVGHESRGRAALRAQWDATWAAIDKMAFFTEIAAIEIKGDKATARSFCREILTLKNGGFRKLIGQYDDQLVRQGGRWLFARRDYSLFMDEDPGAPLLI